jgi:hypothetical protein
MTRSSTGHLTPAGFSIPQLAAADIRPSHVPEFLFLVWDACLLWGIIFERDFPTMSRLRRVGMFRDHSGVAFRNPGGYLVRRQVDIRRGDAARRVVSPVTIAREGPEKRPRPGSTHLTFASQGLDRAGHLVASQ